MHENEVFNKATIILDSNNNLFHFSSVTPPRPISRSPPSEILSSQSVWTLVYDQPVSLSIMAYHGPIKKHCNNNTYRFDDPQQASISGSMMVLHKY